MENIEKQKIRSEICERIVLEVLKDYNYEKLNELMVNTNLQLLKH